MARRNHFLFKLSQGLQNSSVTLDQHQYENVCSLLKEASLPFYTRGLAARVLALVYFRQQQLVHDFQNNAYVSIKMSRKRTNDCWGRCQRASLYDDDYQQTSTG